jgi:hypothetical protein
VGIDRIEEGETLRRAQGRDAEARERAEAAVFTDPERRAIESRLHRALVDRVYGAARDAWAQALPDLRALWAKHVEKYPGQKRAESRTQLDGSWVADGDCKLSPDQNAQATRACADIRKEGKEVILPEMERIEDAEPNRRLVGLIYMLKGEDRLKEKIAERLRYHPDWPARRALNEVPDAVRFTFAYSETQYVDGVCADVHRLKAEGFELIKLKNLWVKEQYRGINSQWRLPDADVRFEVQFHTHASFEAKELTHKAYERLRNPTTTKDEEVQLESYQRQVTSHVPVPPNVFDIKDYPPEM